jgi:hypothetical protein
MAMPLQWCIKKPEIQTVLQLRAMKLITTKTQSSYEKLKIYYVHSICVSRFG